ncbi:MAG: acyl-CoA thioesterase [Thermoplasmata archaeon]
MPPESPPPPVHWRVQRRFPIPYHNIDVLDHLNHASYFEYMETLRCDYYLPLLSSSDPRTLDIIILEASCRYLAPVQYGEILLGEVAPARPVGRTSFTLLYRFTNARGQLTARGKTVVVCYDYPTSSKKAIPPDRKATLEADAIDPATESW